MIWHVLRHHHHVGSLRVLWITSLSLICAFAIIGVVIFRTNLSSILDEVSGGRGALDQSTSSMPTRLGIAELSSTSGMLVGRVYFAPNRRVSFDYRNASNELVVGDVVAKSFGIPEGLEFARQVVSDVSPAIGGTRPFFWLVNDEAEMYFYDDDALAANRIFSALSTQDGNPDDSLVREACAINIPPAFLYKISRATSTAGAGGS